MTIYELGAGTAIQLKLTIDGKHYEFDTLVQMHHKGLTLIEPIRKGDKFLNVQDESVGVDIMYLRPEERPILWHNAKLECVRYKKKIYYSVSADMIGHSFNRRGSYRLFVGDEIQAKIGSAGADREVILNDMSNTGFAFISEDKIDDAEGAFVYITYTGQLEGSTVEMDFYGEIVREMEMEDGRMLYGCALIKRNEMIAHFINQKQMELLARKNGRFAYRRLT